MRPHLRPRDHLPGATQTAAPVHPRSFFPATDSFTSTDYTDFADFFGQFPFRNLCKSAKSAEELSSLHLPVFDELVRNLFQKTRRPLKDIAVSAAQPHVWKGEIELIPRASDCDIKKAPLFFERVKRVERAAARKHAVSEPDHEHSVKLEPLRLMHRGKADRFFVRVLVWRRFCIDVADERQLRKKLVHILELARKSR